MIEIMLVWALAPRQVCERRLSLPEGTTVEGALAAAERAGLLPTLDRDLLATGIWGRAVAGLQVLVDGDRLELCRSLQVDPKVARRERFRQQGSRAPGLFAQRREGGKQGY